MKFKMKNLSVLVFLFMSFYLVNAFGAVENAKAPDIITKGIGQYAYDLWTKNDSSNDIIQMSSSSDYGITWNTPIDLSQAGQNAKDPIFISDSTGQNVFAIWLRYNGTNDIVQFSSSLNNAQTWSTPLDLSAVGQNALTPHIDTDSTGEYICAIWERSNGSNDMIQFSKSSDYGATFSSPFDLSDVGQNSKTPQIATADNINCISATWIKSDGADDIIQFKHSQDFGENWGTTLNLSDTIENANNLRITDKVSYIYAIWTKQEGGIDITQFVRSINNGNNFSEVIDLSDAYSTNTPKIVASSNGQYIYISWYMSNGMYTDAQVLLSNDSGVIFTAPYVLSEFGKNSINTDIATDINGQNTYVVWTRSNGTNDIVQLGKSNDYGATWTTYGMDLSLTGQNAKNPTVSTDETGQKVYVTWARFDGTKDVIQQVYSSDYGATFSVPQVISN